MKCKNSCKVLSLHSGFFWVFWLKFPMKIWWWEIRKLFASEGKALLCLESDCSCSSASKHIHAAFAGGPWVAGAMALPDSPSQGSGRPCRAAKHMAWKNSVGQVGVVLPLGSWTTTNTEGGVIPMTVSGWVCEPWLVEKVGHSSGGRWFIIRLLLWSNQKAISSGFGFLLCHLTLAGNCCL